MPVGPPPADDWQSSYEATSFRLSFFLVIDPRLYLAMLLSSSLFTKKFTRPEVHILTG